MRVMTSFMPLAVLAVVALPGAAAAQHTMDHGTAPSHAVAVVMPTAGNSAHGTVTFAAVEGGVRITAHFEGLTPGEHGFHIHQYGDCSAPNGTSAGGHFNPAGVAHGGPDAETRHVGDLGNVTASAQGVADYDRVDHVVALSGTNNVIGRGIIVHAGKDDLTSQPTGAAGARVACGVIGVGE